MAGPDTAARGAHAHRTVAARGGASGHFWIGDWSGCVTFFNTVVLTYYTYVFDKVGK